MKTSHIKQYTLHVFIGYINYHLIEEISDLNVLTRQLITMGCGMSFFFSELVLFSFPILFTVTTTCAWHYRWTSSSVFRIRMLN
jgi:hypothetical protein